MVEPIWGALVIGLFGVAAGGYGVWYHARRRDRLGMWVALGLVFFVPLVAHKPVNRFAPLVFAIFGVILLLDVCVHAFKKPT